MIQTFGFRSNFFGLLKIIRSFLPDLSCATFLIFNLLSDFMNLIDVGVNFVFVLFVKLFDLGVDFLLVGLVISEKLFLSCHILQLLSLQAHLRLCRSINGLTRHCLQLLLLQLP